MFRLPRALYEELLAAGRAALPREAVGFVYGRREGAVESAEFYHPLRNRAPGPGSFELDPVEVEEAVGATGRPLALFHSHPTDVPAPSSLDIAGAGAWTDLLYLILSLDGAPRIRLWRILEDRAIPELIEISP